MVRWSLVLLGALTVMGCGGDDGAAYGPAEPAENAAPPQPTAAPCRDGATSFCTQIIGRNDLVTSCFDGVVTCVDGKWSRCQPLPAPLPSAVSAAEAQEIP